VEGTTGKEDTEAGRNEERMNLGRKDQVKAKTACKKMRKKPKGERGR